MEENRNRPKPAGVASVAEADTTMAPSLDRLGDADNYTAWIFAHIEPHLGKEVLEVGAGHGTFTKLFRDRAERVVATDVSDRCADMLRERFAGDERVTVRDGSTEVAVGMPPFDSAVLINVLEHIKDDHGALLDLRDSLKPGGRLILWVPAFELLYSDWDRQVGHYRRYRKGDLSAKLVQAGFELTEMRYVNSLGALGWLVLARLLRGNPTHEGEVKFFDSVCVPILRRLESRWGAPFGQSVFAVATRPGGDRRT